MKKLFISLMGIVMCQFAMAQVENTVYTVDDYNGTFYEGIYRVSNNGQWAVASEGVLNDDYGSFAALLWSRETGEYTVINPNCDGTPENGAMIHDVTNDGMVVGAYPKYITPDDGSDPYYLWQPACKRVDGDWVDMPLPADARIDRPMDMTYCSIAKRVTPDGKVVLGECYVMNVDTGKSYFKPVQWFLDDDLNVVETRTFDLDYVCDGFISFDMSADGSVIVGYMNTPRGNAERYPTMLVDGELQVVAKPDLILQDGYDDWYLESEEGYDEEPWNYWDGCVNSIDKDGNIYYYYWDGVEQLHSAVKNIYTGKTTEYDSPVSCGIEGFVVGMEVLKGKEGVTLGDMYAAQNMSDDGMVVAGGGYATTTAGMPYEYPMLIVYSESPATDEVDEPDDEPEPDDGDEPEPDDEPDPEVDGIGSISVDAVDAVIYSVSGEKLNAPKKGVNIINGKKVVVK